MKSVILNKNSNSKSKVFSWLRSTLTVFAALTVVACSNGGGGGGTTVVNPINPNPYNLPTGYGSLGPITFSNCPTCMSTMVAPMAIDLFESINAQGTVKFSQMQLIVNGAGFNPGVKGSFNLYSGPVAAQGMLTITKTFSDMQVGACTVAPGTYYLTSSVVGTLQFGSLVIADLVTTTGNIHFKFTSTHLYKYMGTQGTILYGSINITSVNGVSCSPNFYDSFN